MTIVTLSDALAIPDMATLLLLPHVCVPTALIQKRFVSTLLGDFSMIQHENQIGMERRSIDDGQRPRL